MAKTLHIFVGVLEGRVLVHQLGSRA